jgi:hypothetical protein
VYPYFLFATLLQQSVAPQPAGIPLVEDCSANSRVIAMLDTSAKVEVRFSMAGETQTCYTVTATMGAQRVDGHITGTSLAAIKEFERQRAEAAPTLPAPPPPAPTVAAAGRAPAPAKPMPRLPAFANFSGVDVNRRPLNFASLTGKLILVCFWSPDIRESQRELIAVTGLYSRYHRQGLEAVGISLGLQRSAVLEAMDDFGTTFPVLVDSLGLADHAGVSVDSLPRTFVLNGQHGIIASGLHGRQLETTVQKLMTEQ